MLNRVQKVGSGVGLSLLSGMALAQTAPDVSAATGALASVGTSVGTIGVAMVAAISAGIAFRWIVAFLAK